MKKLNLALISLALIIPWVGCQTSKPAEPLDVTELTIADIHAAYKKGSYTSQQLVAAYLDRINQWDKQINAITAINPNALSTAQELDEEYKRTKVLRPLHGIPIIVKDNIQTKGMATTAGAIALQNFIPSEDAFIMDKLVKAGAILIAKSNMAEWAFTPWSSVSSTHGATLNPYNLDYTPAGSSGGTGASVAANFGTIGLGTDTGNSIRGPSSHCSLVGFRTTLGLISRSGIVPLFLRNDVVGPMCRTVEDATRVLEIMVGYDANDPITKNAENKIPGGYQQFLQRDGLKGARIGVLRELSEGAPDPEIRKLFEKAILDMKILGAVIVDTVEVPDFSNLRKNQWCNEFRKDIEPYLATHVKNDSIKTLTDIIRIGTKLKSVEDELNDALMRPGRYENPKTQCGDAYTDPKRIAFRQAIEDEMDKLKLDAIVYPTWNNKPAKITHYTEDYKGDNNQIISPHTGQPAFTIPMGFAEGNLPAGLQFLGRMYDEPTLIKLAYAYEQGTKHRVPPELKHNPDQADLAFINGRVWTGMDSASFVEALAVKGNLISQIGTSDEISKSIGKETKVIDLDGRLLIPGFNDAHIHFLGGSVGLTEVDLANANTIGEVVQRIKKFAAENPAKKWITGRGWQYTMFTGGLPYKEILDSAIHDRPVFIKAYDGHSAWANSAALGLVKILRTTVFTGFGEIVRAANGEPTGVLKEGAMSLIGDHIPSLSREDKLAALRKGLKLAASLGITSISNASGSVAEFNLYKELLLKNELTLRVAAAFSVGVNTTGEDTKKYTSLKDSAGRNSRLTAHAVKIMLDGVIESHTAGMLEPYSNLTPRETSPAGALALPLDRYRSLVTEFDKLGFQIYTHAIGDRAVREALNAYELAMKANATSGRHRVEHIETISPADIPRFAALGVLPSMEPIHAEPGTVSVWAEGVGLKRLPYSFAWASILKAGGRLVFSSDWPACVSLNPIRGFHTAVTRRTIEGEPKDGWVPEQKISISQALMAYTQGGAYSSFEENTKGKIAPGYIADLVVLSQDFFSIDLMKTYETKVLMTVFDGKIIYEEK